MRTDYDALITTTAVRYALDAELLIAQVVVESGGRADAFHYDLNFYERYMRANPAALAGKFGPLAACSYGLLQVELEVAYERGFMGLPWQLFDAATGLEWGARHLAWLLQRENGEYVKALEAYNAGPGNLAGGAGYAQKVMTEARIWGEHGPH